MGYVQYGLLYDQGIGSPLLRNRPTPLLPTLEEGDERNRNSKVFQSGALSTKVVLILLIIFLKSQFLLNQSSSV